MKLGDYLILFVLLVVSGTIANLIALKIAGDEVSKKLDDAPGANLLKLLGG